jgi:TusA-related sulfurtransferase
VKSPAAQLKAVISIDNLNYEETKMPRDKIEILPTTTVHELLSAYPDLEEKLIGIAPPFKKLQNPLLRKSIAKVATIKNIASVGNIPLDELINKLRDEVGQSKSRESYEDETYFTTKPDWFSFERVSVSIVEEDVEDKDKMTVVTVLREAKKMKSGEIIELITTFLPAPGIDSMRSKGYSVWTMKDEGDKIRTYFLKP